MVFTFVWEDAQAQRFDLYDAKDDRSILYFYLNWGPFVYLSAVFANGGITVILQRFHLIIHFFARQLPNVYKHSNMPKTTEL